MLVIDNLTVSYNGKAVLHDVSLQVQPGEMFALIGPNGAGKSTLIRAISGVIAPQSGTVSYQNDNVLTMNESRRAHLVGVVPQARQLGGAFSVEETVLLGRTPYMGWLGRASEKDQEIVREALVSTCIDHLAQRRIAELSGGEQQRVLLARALAQDTPILLLDEPTNHLDLQHQVVLLNLVQTLVEEKKLIVLMAMHDLNLVSLYSDRVGLLVDGALQHAGQPNEVLTQENISAAYRTAVHVVAHVEENKPLILPDRKANNLHHE
ncbi:MAG: ABC transporter ATP-binding protein [Chloroflexi bacterium]|nr:MAG: ABC transporter ATP-binding protein [Chloroflexota bacterium]MBL1194866.1 ABC transporter ATP-binding protein [Chloroflexota bacterium]NOH12157.1 ABC transporter ATP-binding protein [Chloroflexota bacterium]